MYSKSPSDFEITTKHKNPGGQYVGTASVVCVRHIPTNLYVEVDSYRSQHKSRELALSMIEWALINL